MAQVLHSVEGQVATVVLANEAKYNAMSLGMWQQLGALLDQLGQDESVRVLVLRGQGDKAFVSGADIAEFEQQRSNPEGVAAYDRAVDQVQTALAQFPRPVIAAISGICFGGGLGMALSCDLRYCSAGSRFRMPAARLGLGYAWRGMKSLVGALGPMNAAEAFFTAQIYNAEQAQGLGIVQSVHEDVFAHVDQTARLIASNAPLTLRAAKLAMIAMRETEQADLAGVDAAVADCFASQDYVEGRRAFAEKRPAQFKGQ
jgi:enoyl-CoA hydratase/carnithine racemase